MRITYLYQKDERALPRKLLAVNVLVNIIIIIIIIINVFQVEITLHVAQTVNTEQLQHCIYRSDMVCFRCVILNTLYRGDNKEIIIIIIIIQNIFLGRNNITCSTDCKYRTAAKLYTLETWFVSGYNCKYPV